MNTTNNGHYDVADRSKVVDDVGSAARPRSESPNRGSDFGLADVGRRRLTSGRRHLLVADGSLDELRRESIFFALCWAELPARRLLSGSCSPGCEDTACITFCAACVEAAVQRNAELAGARS